MGAKEQSGARWLLLIHQLPPSPAYRPVKTGRQLQKVGGVAVKNSVHVLSNTESAVESFACHGAPSCACMRDCVCTHTFGGQPEACSAQNNTIFCDNGIR